MSDIPDFSGNACAAFSLEERNKLWWAANTLADQRNLIVQITNAFGQSLGGLAGRAARLGARVFGDGWRGAVGRITEDVLWRAHDFAIVGLDNNTSRAPRSRINKALTSASGAIAGFVGAPGILVDVPVTTLMIMRSIAEIGRSYGEDITSDAGKRACLEVMAFGGPDTGDEEVEIGYWSTRAAMSHVTLQLLVRQVAGRFGVVLSEKFLAQAVPIAGAVAGGSLNYLFMDFYQQMARVHFTIRQIERAHGSEAGVRACLDALVRQARTRKSVGAGPAASVLALSGRG